MNNGVINQEIQKAYDELFSSILSEQSKFQSLKDADPDKANLIEEELKKYESKRGKGFFFNYLSSGRGHGPFTELIDGSIKFDLIGAIGVNLMGHSHPQYIKGVLDASLVDTIMCGNLLTYQAPKNLTETLINKVKGSRLTNFWFSGSGSFANDVALKILWQKSQPKYELIAFKKTFAGRSIATQDITYNPDYRKGMPKSIDVHHAEHFDQKDPTNSLSKTLKSLDDILEKSKGNITGLTIELVQGEGGFIYGPKEYYKGICDWARDKEIKIWFDEVQTFARTPELFSFQHFGLDEYADVVTIGKVLQGAGTFYTDELNPAPGLIAGTFNGSIAGLTTGNRIINYLCDNNYYGDSGKIKQLEQKFINGIKKLSETSCKGKIGYVGGIGTMISFEVGDSSKDITTKYVKQLYQNGIISFFAGMNPTRVRFLLPICLTDEHIDQVMKIIEKTTNEII